ncbi:hypothetical protein Dsin_029977 [Dipteronia sinensis]|uniref:Endonuclease/exonuclease/phosphatase domain-containing protein n=1 Tax=Dipteronia sinensis TaxID=43782 RepID=A0AAD9ZHR0_9ROSI|nr:hypothetical protein Dsin_029977 [Dipteronia sinensis]
MGKHIEVERKANPNHKSNGSNPKWDATPTKETFPVTNGLTLMSSSGVGGFLHDQTLVEELSVNNATVKENSILTSEQPLCVDYMALTKRIEQEAIKMEEDQWVGRVGVDVTKHDGLEAECVELASTGLPEAMKILCWNDRGMRSARVFQVLLSLKRAHNLDVIFLIGTKADRSRMEDIRVKLGFSGKLVVEATGRSGGLCLLWIDTTDSQRHHAWTLLRRLNNKSSLPWACAGDFNEILDHLEKLGGVQKSQTLLDNFCLASDECGLQDIGFSGATFTWCNKRDGYKIVQERLDRCVSNFRLQSLLPRSKVVYLEYWKSDHRPILVEVLQSSSVGDDRNGLRRCHFHFEACWMEKEGCVNIIEQHWRGHDSRLGLTGVVADIQQCTKKLEQWYSKNKSELWVKIKEKQDELKLVTSHIRSGSWERISKVEKELDSLLQQEEDYWRQRSRVTWLQSGDKNSKYFHWRVSVRKRRNLIHGLYGETGRWTTKQVDVCRIFEHYFSDFFCSNFPLVRDLDKVFKCVQPCLSDGKKSFLDTPFSVEEVKRAVFDMAPTKAPGLDGLPVIFYQKF